MAMFYIVMGISLLLGILYHEYGHMVTAKHYGVRVSKFCVGFGKMIWKKRGKDGTDYGIAPIPFGGYCEIDEKELDKKPMHQYIAILVAGVARNLVLGVVLYILGTSLIFVANGKVPNILAGLEGAFLSICNIMGSFWDTLVSFFNIKEIAAYGGVVSQTSMIGSQVQNFGETFLEKLGVCLIAGGGINFALMMCNLLPIPAIDGGQIVIRLIRKVLAVVFGKEIVTKKIADLINTFGFCFLLFYQGIILLCDIPAVQNFILNL